MERPILIVGVWMTLVRDSLIRPQSVFEGFVFMKTLESVANDPHHIFVLTLESL